MSSFEFTLVLAVPEESEDDAGALYAQFDDGSIITSGGVTRIEFDREAPNLREAIRSAIDDVERAGFQVVRVESEIAETIAAINAELAGASG